MSNEILLHTGTCSVHSLLRDIPFWYAFCFSSNGWNDIWKVNETQLLNGFLGHSMLSISMIYRTLFYSGCDIKNMKPTVGWKVGCQIKYMVLLYTMDHALFIITHNLWASSSGSSSKNLSKQLWFNMNHQMVLILMYDLGS